MRKELFTTVSPYRVKVDFSCGGIDFIKGEVLDFVCDGYSPYDDCFIYEFKDAQGLGKNWILPTDAEACTWQDLFEPLP